jgi:dipeptidyl aminopeptidase/acylaminoacyl peptidase
VVVLSGPGLTEQRTLTTERGNWRPLAWSQDDAFIVAKHYESIAVSTLYVVEVATGTKTKVEGGRTEEGEGVACGMACFLASPRGGSAYTLAFTSNLQSEFSRLHCVDLTETGAVVAGSRKCLTPNLDWSVNSLAVSAKHLAFTCNEGGESALFLLPCARLVGESGGSLFQRVRDYPGGKLTGLDFDTEGRRLAFSCTTAVSPGDVFVLDLSAPEVDGAAGGGESVKMPLARWTQSEVGGLDTSKFVRPKLFSYPSFDSRQIPCFAYYPPPSFQGPRPVVIRIHGTAYCVHYKWRR